MTAAELEAENTVEKEALKYEDKIKFVNAIASPLATKKLHKRLMKLIRAACMNDKKKNIRIGLKDVQRNVRKGETGLMVFAGDVSPIDVMSHLPAVCEEKNIPYCYIPSQRDLAVAVGFTNSCLVAMVKENESYQELYNQCAKEMKKLACLV